MLVLGSIGYILFFIYDLNSVLWKKQIFRFFFFLGSILIVVGSTIQFVSTMHVIQFSVKTVILVLLAVLAFLLLIYTLFFCFSFDETYISQDNRKVYDKGLYGICRHPGILWFFLLYVVIGILLYPTGFLWKGLILSFYNFIYAYFQDIYTFMHTFDDYADYKKNVPFFPFMKVKESK